MRPISREAFEELVAQALEGLPDRFLERLDNVGIVVEEQPSRAQLNAQGMGPGETMLGLYEGISLPDRESYGMVLPDKITIFQRPLEQYSENEADLVDQVMVTVAHEIAHHFGMDDDRLHELGL